MVFPQELLAQPEIRLALAARSFATVFTAAKNAGLSYNRLAEATGIKAEKISLVARGAASITAMETIERIADGLRIPGAMLGLAARCWEQDSTEHPGSSRQEPPMRRRELLRDALAAGLTTGSLTHVAAVLASAEQALTYTGRTDLTQLHAVVERYSHGYRGRPATDILAELTDQVATVAPLLQQHHPQSQRTELARILGQLGGMTAIVLHDLGREREAYAWFATATQAGEQSGDRSLQAWVLARKAMVGLNFGAPQLAADLAEHARHVAGRANTAASALSAAVAARAYALTREPGKALTAMRDADRIAAALPARERADTWLGHCEQKHHVHLSQALTVLGHTGRARETQTAALQLTPSTSTLTRTLLRLDAAACEHHDGRTLDACHLAVEALSDIPPRSRVGLPRRRAGDLYGCVPGALRSHPQARALKELLAG
ncbi:helix-turn-helix transcriptional regulator [Nucisporomicrobium flavum]|uniref:helix-turn-helix transcriptional regulator n=1 Tax=Nucisporomicrobium flavum TaxID=2785915 RepID=UPI0027DCE135|nr:helix-turn-helix transcriptional regulator [Nucisporomicrobium flavum]